MKPPDAAQANLPPIETLPGASPLGLALLGSTNVTPEAQLTGMTAPGAPFQHGRTRTQIGYLLPFEIVSVHLLVVLIGAAYLARAKRRRVLLTAPPEARA
jgi:NADH-quinone oxidoreductase subunit J